MIKIVPAAAVQLLKTKRNKKNEKFTGVYRIQSGKPIEFLLIRNRQTGESRFLPAIAHKNYEEYIKDSVLKQAKTNIKET
ncbi:MAG: hypothetical protein KBF82_04560 [Chitinophagaceae bacterium]|nr:hypothetical protein [Chitinophagaceae bacterium]MBP9103115.1 hypothetical protein [Chitinophagaceae bacterium]